jgi:hypothetical protein
MLVETVVVRNSFSVLLCERNCLRLLRICDASSNFMCIRRGLNDFRVVLCLHL